MKAQSLWAGHDYAHWHYRSRGTNYTPNIERVRVIKVVKEKSVYKKNETTYADVEVLDWDGNRLEPSVIKRIRAYDIVDFWDDYWAEHGEALLKNKAWREEQERIRKEREEEFRRRRIEQEERYRREREEREAREAAEREKLQHKRNAIIQALYNKGLTFERQFVSDRYTPNNDVYLDDKANSVTIRGEELKRWLKVEEYADDAAKTFEF